MSDTPSEGTIAAALAGIADPEVGRTFGELNMIKSVDVADGKVTVNLDLPTPAYPDKDRLGNLICGAVQAIDQDCDVDVNYGWTVQGKNTGGSIGLRVKNVICVGSGKGGVGKSTIAASLAYGLKTFGAKVGLMDADVYGPSLPHMMGVGDGRPLAVDQPTADGQTVTRITPIDADGMKLMSMGFFVEPEKAVVWRGPMLHRALTQFLKDTEWGELDYLIIDLPPGTGDVSLTLSQLLGLAGAVVVCTPQQVALLDAIKAINMYEQVKVPILGIVENMSGDIFGRGGAKAQAEKSGIPFLGEVPIEADIRIKGDEGRIADLFAEDSPARPHLLNVCEQVAIGVARQLLESPSLPTLEVL